MLDVAENNPLICGESEKAGGVEHRGCRTCDGFGYGTRGIDPTNTRRVTCDECDGTGLANCDACEAQNGEACLEGPRTCRSAHLSALDAGIPLSVIRGETKLTDHFSPAYIAEQAGVEACRACGAVPATRTCGDYDEAFCDECAEVWR